MQLLLGHTKESTVRYLGVEVDDATATSDQVDLKSRLEWLVQIAPAIPLPQRIGLKFADNGRRQGSVVSR